MNIFDRVAYYKNVYPIFDLRLNMNQLIFAAFKMYSKDESSQLKQAFWTTFGKYMGPVLSADGLRINWINYKTGVKHVNFKMLADSRTATISIEITHPDLELQELFFDQFKDYKNVLHSSVGEEWEWAMHTTDESGKTITKIYKQLTPVSIFQQEDWPRLISFFKPRIIALDEFWSSAKFAFGA